MSYTTAGLTEVVLKKRADLNTLGDIGAAGVNSFAPAFQPYYVRGVMAVIDNDIGATGQIKFDKRPTVGTDSGRGDGDVGVLNLTTAHTQGKIVYKFGLNVLITPGQEVIAEVTDVTAASDVADIVLLVEPASEVAANLPKMVLST